MKTVLLIGLGPTALSALESLASRCHVVAVIRDVADTEMTTDEVAKFTTEHAIPLQNDVTMEGVRNALKSHQPAGVVVSSYDRVLPADVIGRSRFANVHYAPLPEYRGRANVNWAIINGEQETAISIHVLAPGLDSGNILYQQRVPINQEDTVTTLYAKLNGVQREVLGTVIDRYLAGYDGEPQDETRATYSCTRTPDDGEIDWSASTSRIHALVRALTPPYPGAFTYLGTSRLHIVRAEPLADPRPYAGRIPGRVTGRSSTEGHVEVLTGDGIYRIHEIRRSDGTVRPAAESITSTKQTLGLRTADLLARLAVLEDTVKHR